MIEAMGCLNVKATRVGKGLSVSCGLVCTVNKESYLHIVPDHIFLMPGNQFRDNTLVYSNVQWKIEE